MMNMPDLGSIDAIILAGGLGTRLRSIVADRQKAFAAVGEQPFVARLLKQLQHAGVRRVIFALGHMAESARPWIERWRTEFNIDLVESIEPVPMGTGGAIRLALSQATSDPVLVLNGDSFVDANLKGFFSTHQANGCPITLCAVHVKDASRFGALALDAGQQHILAFHEKSAQQSGPAWINAGIYLMQRDMLTGIPADRAVSLEREVFPHYVGTRLGVFLQDKPFIDIGTPESYATGADFFSSAK